MSCKYVTIHIICQSCRRSYGLVRRCVLRWDISALDLSLSVRAPLATGEYTEYKEIAKGDNRQGKQKSLQFSSGSVTILIT